MYTLYGKKGSGSASTEAALALVNAPYRIVETASWERNAAFDDLLQLNPLGQIPTLVLPDGSVLSESAAILIHLGSVHPEAIPAVEHSTLRHCATPAYPAHSFKETASWP